MTMENGIELNTQKSTIDQVWELATHLSDEIQSPLIAYQNELYKKYEANRSQLGVAMEEREKDEGNYWRVTAKIEDLEEQIKKLTEAISKFENKEISEQDLKDLLPKGEKEKQKLSKKKEAVQRENERLRKLGVDPREICWDTHAINFGSDAHRLTTGRHQKSIHGNLDTFSAGNAFFEATVDTHGGKVGHGKNGDSYASASGRRIRKR